MTKVSSSALKSQPLNPTEEQTQIKELVESAIDNDDILPLVRLVLDGQVDSGSPFSNSSTLETVPEMVKGCLRSLIEESNSTAAVHSKANTAAITSALEELESIQKSMESLSVEYQSINGDLQSAGEGLLERMKEFTELQEMEDTLLIAGRNLEWACTILQRCLDGSDFINQHKLYQALNILEEIQEQMKDDADSTSEILQSFVKEILVDLRTAIQHMAVTDFNDWLVTARSEARQIGLQGIRQASINRQHKDRCAEERKAILDNLKSSHSFLDTVSLVSSALGTHEAMGETPNRPAFQSMDVASLTGTVPPVGHDDDRTSVLSDRSGMTGSLFQPRSGGGFPVMDTNKAGMNMRGLHRCIYVHKRLGKLGQFREYYMEQRRLQIDSDLRPPSNFLEVYQSYLAQVTGFFIVEDNVLRMTDGLLQQQDVDGFWEMAIVMLKRVVDNAFEGLTSAPAMLLVKDFLLLVCSSLSKSGYPAANLKEILSSNTGKYHALMNDHVISQVNKILRDDTMVPVKIKSKERYQELITNLRLPDSTDVSEKPDRFPFLAPFTETVPQIMFTIHEYVRDSIAYLKGLINPGDVLTTACHHRDKMIKVMFDAIQSQINSMRYSDLSLRGSMQLVSNIWALGKGLGTIDEWTARLFTGSGSSSNQQSVIARRPSVNTGSSGNYQIPLKGLEESCVRAVVHVASHEINRFLSQIETWDFIPRTVPTAATSPLVEELIIYLQGVYDIGRQQMTKNNAETTITAVMNAVGSGFLDLLCGNSVPAINDFGFARLLEDLTALEQFAEHFGVLGLSKEISSPRRLCSFILEGSSFTDDVSKIMQQLSDISARSLVAALEKYREVGGWQAQRSGRRVSKKKEVDQLIKKLKEQLH